MAVQLSDVYIGASAFAAAIVLSVLLTPVVTAAARRLRLFDNPDGARRIHHEPIPRVGGVAVFLAAAGSLALFAPDVLVSGRPYHLSGIAIGAAVMFAMGLVDDLRGLPPVAKLAGQLLAAGGAIWISGYPERLAILPGSELYIGWLGAPLLLVWIVAVTNAYNLVDGLNGLATGVAIVACATAFAIGGILQNSSTIVAVVLTGALLGFARYNFPRASVFLGDSGTMSIGFLLSLLLVRASTTGSGAVLVLVPIFALMVPFLDTGLAIVRRFLRKVPLSGADARHIHHRLLAMGLSQPETVIRLWALGVIFTGFGLLITLAPPAIAGVIMLLGSSIFAIVVIYGTNILAYHELSVAREVLVEGPGRIRRVISEQIYAVDLCESIGKAASVAEVNALLQRSTDKFGVSRMTLRADSRHPAPEPDLPGDERTDGMAGWRLDFHITAASRGYVATLSIWCDTHDGRVSGAERVARILAPALSAWLEEPSQHATRSQARQRRSGFARLTRRRWAALMAPGAGDRHTALGPVSGSDRGSPESMTAPR